MNLRKILGFSEKVIEEKVEYIDEDLSCEEISEKIRNMDWNKASNYVKKLSPSKKSQHKIYLGQKWENLELNYFKKHRMTMAEEYDVEHSSEID